MWESVENCGNPNNGNVKFFPVYGKFTEVYKRIMETYSGTDTKKSPMGGTLIKWSIPTGLAVGTTIRKIMR